MGTQTGAGTKSGKMLYVGLGIVVILVILGVVYLATMRSSSTTTALGSNSNNQTAVNCPCLSENQMITLLNDSQTVNNYPQAEKTLVTYKTNYTINPSSDSQNWKDYSPLIQSFTGQISEAWTAIYSQPANYSYDPTEIVFHTNNSIGLYDAVKRNMGGGYTMVSNGSEVNGLTYSYFVPSSNPTGTAGSFVVGYKGGYVVWYYYPTKNPGVSSPAQIASVINNTLG